MYHKALWLCSLFYIGMAALNRGYLGNHDIRLKRNILPKGVFLMPT